jgi:hypothetical protein
MQEEVGGRMPWSGIGNSPVSAKFSSESYRRGKKEMEEEACSYIPMYITVVFSFPLPLHIPLSLFFAILLESVIYLKQKRYYNKNNS